MKVLISDDMSPLAARVFTERGIEADVKTGLGADDLLACIGDYDGLAVRSATKVTSKLLQRAERLKVIGRAGIGIDNIDCTAATGAGILVMNTPLGNAITTAEHAIAMMLSLARQIPQANQSTHQGKWEKSRFLGVEVMGKTLGIIGCGNVGSIVADRAQGLKMKVIAFDPYLSLERAQELGVETVELDGLFQRADFISLHTPLTDATRGIIDAAAIAKMKPGVRIINCAPRQPGGGGGPQGSPDQRPGGGGGARRVRRGTGQDQHPVRPGEPGGDAPFWVPPPRKPRRRWRCRWPNRWPTSCSPAPSSTPSTCRRSAPRRRRSSNPT